MDIIINLGGACMVIGGITVEWDGILGQTTVWAKVFGITGVAIIRDLEETTILPILVQDRIYQVLTIQTI